MSIRLRLTLLYSAILAVTLVGFSVALYAAVSSLTLSSVSDALALEIKNYGAVTQLAMDPDRPGSVLVLLPRNVQASQDYLQVRSLTGTVLYSSNNLKALAATLPLDGAARHQARPGRVLQSTVTVGGQRLLVDTMLFVSHRRGSPNGGPQGPPPANSATPIVPPAADGGQGAVTSAKAGPEASGTLTGILQLATSLRGVDQTLATLRAASLLGGVLVILLACGAGFALAGTALRPITRLTQAAQEIGERQDFERRVDYEGPPDEVGRLAGTFNTMLDRLSAAYHTQRRFVGDASHELRTPLTTIRGNLGLLERAPPIAEEDRAAVTADLVSETERLMRLVGDLLTLARSDVGRPLRQENVPLRPLLATLRRRLAVAYPGREIGQQGDIEVVARGDPDALTQVLLILLDNALKFTPPHGTVGVILSVDEDHVAIGVRDTGPGIAPHALQHIFERFYQADEARAGTGTGLGLAIARALVEAQHGTISVQSQVGRGSVFTVVLPRAAG